MMEAIAELPRARARVYEHGWQSWSPAGLYAAESTSPRPARAVWQTMAFRPGRPAPPAGFQGEGLLAVETGDGGPVHVFSASDPRHSMPSIRARVVEDRLLVEADGDVRHRRCDGSIDDALARWAMEAAEALGAVTMASLGPAWCSWYGGAIEGGRRADATGLDAYLEGLRLIRDAAGEEATLLACGAPLLPSIGLVDAMRISPDVAPEFEPPDGDVSQPSGRGAFLAGRARAFQHARLWVNDPDCLLARPAIERREAWAEHVGSSGGLVASSDPLRALDDWGLATTRRLLRPSSTLPLTTALGRAA